MAECRASFKAPPLAAVGFYKCGSGEFVVTFFFPTSANFFENSWQSFAAMLDFSAFFFALGGGEIGHSYGQFFSLTYLLQNLS